MSDTVTTRRTPSRYVSMTLNPRLAAAIAEAQAHLGIENRADCLRFLITKGLRGLEGKNGDQN